MQSLILFFFLLLLCQECYCFGAGNIPSFGYMEGKAFRHGDIADALLEIAKTASGSGLLGSIASIAAKKFHKMDVQRIYFGNWLRDFSQAMDVGTLSKVPKETIMNLLMVFGFLSLGYATEEFEITQERLGVYRPEEHIDNPKGYPADAQRYHPNLRPPVQDIELQIDPQTGMKNYIRNEGGGWATSSAFIRKSLESCIQHGRRYQQSKNKQDKYEAFRLMGQLLHTLEDFPAHSNFVELCLIQMGYHQVFAHVGDHCFVYDPQGRQVHPLVTGTFGSSDFLYSLLGEAQDKISEASISDLDKEIQHAKKMENNSNELMGLLGQVPGLDSGITREMDDIRSMDSSRNGDRSNLDDDQVKTVLWKVLIFRDRLMKNISKIIDSIPGLGWLTEKISETLTVWVLEMLEPYVKPVIVRVMTGLHGASAQVMDNPEQYAVFDNPNSSDPTHSFLSKDHFNLLLNEPAGWVAQVILKHTVQLIVKAWNDDNVNIHQLSDTILEAFFHPAFHNPQSEVQKNMLQKVQEWAKQNGQFMDRLNKQSVRAGKNTRSGKAIFHGTCHGEQPTMLAAFGGKRRNVQIGDTPSQSYGNQSSYQPPKQHGYEGSQSSYQPPQQHGYEGSQSSYQHGYEGSHSSYQPPQQHGYEGNQAGYHPPKQHGYEESTYQQTSYEGNVSGYMPPQQNPSYQYGQQMNYSGGQPNYGHSSHGHSMHGHHHHQGHQGHSQPFAPGMPPQGDDDQFRPGVPLGGNSSLYQPGSNPYQ